MSRLSALPLALVLAAGLAAGTASASESVLRLTGMTFVGSKSERGELVLRSERARFRPEQNVANLEGVEATVTDRERGRSFTMTCQRAELNVETNDFTAEGEVRGVTSDGQRYAAPWVRYQHDEGLLYTEAPVEMVDATGTFRGDGFRYHVRERRFKLLGNVRVVQTP